MSWSAEAWKSIEPTVDGIRRHPFVTELAEGTLPQAKFDIYLEQDRIYLANYAVEMNALAAMLPDGHLSDLYRKFAEESMEAEKALHEEMSGKKDIDFKPLAGTSAYMGHTSGIIASGDLALSMAAMLPCMWVYNEIGKYITGMAKMEGNPYRSWIECYTSPLMDDGARCSVELTDRLADRGTAEQRRAMTEAFMKSAEFELIFWNQAYHYHETL